MSDGGLPRRLINYGASDSETTVISGRRVRSLDIDGDCLRLMKESFGGVGK